jgi:hypothetical protein
MIAHRMGHCSLYKRYGLELAERLSGQKLLGCLKDILKGSNAMRSLRLYLPGIPLLLVSLASLVVLMSAPGAALAAENNSFLNRHQTISTLASTVPDNGDVNPYGVAVVPTSSGRLLQDHVLVSNFNNNHNLQGTGTTIVQVSPGGKEVSLFAQLNVSTLPGDCPGGIGLTTALVVLRRGWVIVGSLPTADGTAATAQAGCLIVLNSQGQAVETFSAHGINGPWDMTAFDQGDHATLFVTNVLNGTAAAGGTVVNQGTILRINLDVPTQRHGQPQITAMTTIADQFAERTDPAALVVGPTGVGLGEDGTLYVADSVNSRIAAIPQALTRETSAGAGNTVSSNGLLNDPLGLTIAPNGNILTVNGNDGNIVETTPAGTQLAHVLLDSSVTPPGLPGAGCLFGLAIIGKDAGVYFVDDCFNTLNTLK